MKNKKIKLSLNKETIARLDAVQLSNVRGGDDVPVDGEDPNGDTINAAAPYLSSIKECTGFMCCDPNFTKEACITEQNDKERCKSYIPQI